MFQRLSTTRPRPGSRLAGAVTTAAMVATALLAGATGTASAADGATTPSPVLWGMNDGDHYDALENDLGRDFAIVRQYRRIDQAFVSSRMQSLVNGGRSMVVSVRARTASAPVSYKAITNGNWDTELVNGMRQLNALATPTYFIFQHEVDSTSAKESCTTPNDAVCGDEFVPAWRHIHDLAQANGFDKLLFTWTVTGYGFNPQTGVRNNHYWPGAAYTDWVGVDAYNGGCEQSWYGSFAETLDYTVDWVQAHAPGKPIVLPEYAATEGSTAQAKANYFRGIPDTLANPRYANVKAVLYWHEQESNCDFRVNSSANAYDAFREVGHHPIVSGRAADPVVVGPGGGVGTPASPNDPASDPGNDGTVWTQPTAKVPVDFEATGKPKRNKVKLIAEMPKKFRGDKVKFFRVKKNGDRVFYAADRAGKAGNAHYVKKFKKKKRGKLTFVSVVVPDDRKHKKTKSNRNRARI